MRRRIDAVGERGARQRVDVDRPGDDRHRRQVVLDGFRERLGRHVDVEIVVISTVVVVLHNLVVVSRTVGNVHGRRRLLAVEAVVDVAVCVRDARE